MTHVTFLCSCGVEASGYDAVHVAFIKRSVIVIALVVGFLVGASLGATLGLLLGLLLAGQHRTTCLLDHDEERAA